MPLSAETLEETLSMSSINPNIRGSLLTSWIKVDLNPQEAAAWTPLIKEFT